METSVVLNTLLVMTLLYAFVQIGVGFATSSLALVSDGFHMISDSMSHLIALVAYQLAKSSTVDADDDGDGGDDGDDGDDGDGGGPTSESKAKGKSSSGKSSKRKGIPDSRLAFGWRRAEIVGAFFNSTFLLAILVMLLIDAVQRFVEPELVESPMLVLWVGLVGLVINIIGMVMLYSAASPHGGGGGGHGHSHGGHGHSHGGGGGGGGDGTTSIGLRAVFLHVAVDLFGSVLVIVSALVAKMAPAWGGTPYIDPAVTVVLAVVMAVHTVPVLSQSVHLLSESSPHDLDVGLLRDEIVGSHTVSHVPHLHVWRLDAQDTVMALATVVASDGTSEYEALQEVKVILHRHGAHSSTVEVLPPPHPDDPRGGGGAGAGASSGAGGSCIDECTAVQCCKLQPPANTAPAATATATAPAATADAAEGEAHYGGMAGLSFGGQVVDSH
jgi:zinc transporter 1